MFRPRNTAQFCLHFFVAALNAESTTLIMAVRKQRGKDKRRYQQSCILPHKLDRTEVLPKRSEGMKLGHHKKEQRGEKK